MAAPSCSHNITGVSCVDQRVIFNGKPLEDDALLSLAGVEEEATLYCLGALLGGAKKRKKKTYTKPKKQKHKHKKASRDSMRSFLSHAAFGDVACS